MTEVPALLTSPILYTTSVEDAGEVSLTTQAPYVRIRIHEYKDGRPTECILVTFLPDRTYEGEISRLASNPTLSDYSGIVIYSWSDGTPLFGWRYVDGMPMNTLRFEENYRHKWIIDRDTRVGMGVGHAAETRGIYTPITITTVVCVATYEDPMEWAKKLFAPTLGDGPDPDRPDGPGAGGIGDEPGTGTGGGSPGSTIEGSDLFIPMDPCGNTQQKMAHEGFVQLLGNVTNAAFVENYEAGVAYSYSNGTYRASVFSGLPGDDSAEIPHAPTGYRFNGIMHSHYSGQLPIFSPQDLLIPGLLENRGDVTDLPTFAMMVSTPR